MSAAAAGVLAIGVSAAALFGTTGDQVAAQSPAAQSLAAQSLAAQAMEQLPVANADELTAATGGATANLRQVVGKVIATRPGGQNRVVGADTPMVVGDELSTAAEAFASLEVGKARVDLSAATTLQLSELDTATQRFYLQAGRVDVSVPRVPGEPRLVQVTTADAKVTVHGTVFSVEVRQDEAGPVTTVGVTRGLVGVERKAAFGTLQSEVLLHPGETWNSRSGQVSSALGAVKGPRLASGTKARGASKATAPETREVRDEAVSSASDPAEARRASDLAEQNRLFELAMRARDRGDDERAAQVLKQLLGAHPDSPLKATAQAELARANRRLEE
jgi:hypothetical protein